ncbi:MAG: ParB/RepB/Spo0J family partition protein [Candidatus Thiodiazotropha sp. (ex Lucinoma borealis)]|nr:ParB/RepB/Spo0J family partition protein [Candidatus Thiodiazotropha sp. (ex Lucinoma borealis)]
MATSKKNSELFDISLDDDFQNKSLSEPTKTTHSSRQKYLHQRETSLEKIASGDFINKTLQKIDPTRCRPWEHHNRRYSLLNETRCQDLIEGIKAQNGQEFPAIVRAVKNDPNYDFEVICGARRHWAISWLREHYYDFKFLIDVRNLSDEEAFRLSDIENRDREDISDYERAVDYKNALNMYYKSAKEMAERLDVSQTWLSRFLGLAKMPEPILDAYPDITHVKENHYRELKPLLKGIQKNIILARAKELVKEQNKRRKNEESPIDGISIFKELKSAIRTPSAKNSPIASYTCSTSKKPMLDVSRNGKLGFVLKLHTGSGASKEELTEAFTEMLNEYYAN